MKKTYLTLFALCHNDFKTIFENTLVLYMNKPWIKSLVTLSLKRDGEIRENEKFCETVLPVHIGPRWSFDQNKEIS